MQSDYFRYTLQFKFNAGTSRGVLHTKDSWFIKIRDEKRFGIGECGILKGLSVENFAKYEDNISKILNTYSSDNQKFKYKSIQKFPSIRFGLEMAERDFLSSGNGILFENDFTTGIDSIPINGLVWMGEYKFMYNQIKHKINDGFSCIKLKIGAIDFDRELNLLKYIRTDFADQDIEIRLDANGAFKPETALEKLKRLSDFQIHSIEQPIKAVQWPSIAELCETSPIDIALDEELIGVDEMQQKQNLLNAINPQYIVLKPSLLGGYRSSEEWMQLAAERNIGYWVTSALESNIGLNAIAQWTYDLGLDIPQGLGTGQLYTNNFEGPLYIKNASLRFNPDIPVYQNFNLF